jgi:3-hydroxyisobutyrate dehydrogenase-like beta-hydroxyacid dehydrogenase
MTPNTELTTTPPHVAIIGAGTMGAAIGHRLLAARAQVHLWNRTPSRLGLADECATVVARVA